MEFPTGSKPPDKNLPENPPDKNLPENPPDKIDLGHNPPSPPPYSNTLVVSNHIKPKTGGGLY